MKADNKMSAVFRHSSRAAGSRSKIPDRMATTRVTADRIDLDIAGADATVVADIDRTQDRPDRQDFGGGHQQNVAPQPMPDDSSASDEPRQPE